MIEARAIRRMEIRRPSSGIRASWFTNYPRALSFWTYSHADSAREGFAADMDGFSLALLSHVIFTILTSRSQLSGVRQFAWFKAIDMN
jgi:hypothetical protein